MFGFVGSLNWGLGGGGFKGAVFVTWDCFIFGKVLIFFVFGSMVLYSCVVVHFVF